MYLVSTVTNKANIQGDNGLMLSERIIGRMDMPGTMLEKAKASRAKKVKKQ